MRTLLVIATIIGHLVLGTTYAKDQSLKGRTNAIEQANDTPLTSPLAVATYLGNEGIFLSDDGNKVLFDPFFHNDYGSYQLVPEDLRTALFSGTPPYDNIDAIFISHAHGDHFSADDMVRYLKVFPATKVVAPKQAITAIMKIEGAEEITGSLVAIELAYKDAPIHGTIGSISYDAVRIPHAGWPERTQISNLVFRVSLANQVTVVHMGDADSNDLHFKPLVEHWQKQHSNTAFPPYWFLTSAEGQLILSDRIGADTNIGLHVPVQVPDELKTSKQKYFSTPGERFSIEKN